MAFGGNVMRLISNKRARKLKRKNYYVRWSIEHNSFIWNGEKYC